MTSLRDTRKRALMGVWCLVMALVMPAWTAAATDESPVAGWNSRLLGRVERTWIRA